MMRTAALALLSVILAHSQSFDVASVKPSPSDGGLLNINHGSLTHGVVTLTNVTLAECIEYAYGLISDDQVDGEAWTRDRHTRFDITAKTSPDASLEQVRPMMQKLLAERFHLAVHPAQKSILHLELTVSRKGLKMPESMPGATAHPLTYKVGRLSYDQITTHTLTVLLSRLLKKPVLDQTALTGLYDIRLEWAPDDTAPADPTAVPLPDIFQAVEEQLGLHLESRKTPIAVIAIDRAEQVPIAN
jgi:uncharacterized protein (TIGR03435 family)